MKTITVIGGGNMGSAIISKIHKTHKVILCEKDKARAGYLNRKYKLRTASLANALPKSDIVLLAVKPQNFEEILAEIGACLGRPVLFISIAAGITTTFIEKRLGPSARVIRTMPNMPAQIGEGLTAICRGRRAKAADEKTAVKIFNEVGKTIVVKESMMDAVTAVSGSGPAYVFLFAECLVKAARAVGLAGKLGEDLVVGTLEGSIHQLIRLKEDPAVLRGKVTSKGGTTQAAMDVFFAKGIDKIFDQAVKAAKKRAGELSVS